LPLQTNTTRQARARRRSPWAWHRRSAPRRPSP
jgi:hypothetical protein